MLDHEGEPDARDHHGAPALKQGMKQKLWHWHAQKIIWQNVCQQQQAVQRKIKKEGKEAAVQDKKMEKQREKEAKEAAVQNKKMEKQREKEAKEAAIEAKKREKEAKAQAKTKKKIKGGNSKTRRRI